MSSLLTWAEGPPPLARPLLDVAEALYRGGLLVRRGAYRSGLFRRRSVLRPVISVGNLTAGGNGKTPLVIELARRLKGWGMEVVVVTRGYGAPRPSAGGPLVVARRGELLASPEEAGDEPLLIALRAGVTVVVSPDRVAGARHGIDALGAQVILLDDGFQHWRLARDLDLVLVDAARPFDNGRLLPRGRLREPPSALTRADLVVVHRGDVASMVPAPSKPPGQVEVAVQPRSLRLGDHREAPDVIRGARVALVAGIARPERFLATVEGLGATVVDRLFVPDHAPLSEQTMKRALSRAKDRGADRVLLTEKDAARMSGRNELQETWVLELDLLVVGGEAKLDAALAAAVDKGGPRSPT